MKRFILLFILIAVLDHTRILAAATSSQPAAATLNVQKGILAKIMNNAGDKYANLTIVFDSVVSVNPYVSRAYFGYINSSNEVIYICQDTAGSEAYTYNIIKGARSIDSSLFYLQYFYPGEHHNLYGNEFPKYSGQKMSATFSSSREITWTLGYSSMTVDQYGAVVQLPVELTSFTATAEGSSVIMQWTTATETNNAGFQIERNLEGTDEWVTVIFINGSGTSSAPKSYSYEDKNLPSGTYTYRMKQIDNCGTVTLYHPNEMPKVTIASKKTIHLSDNYPNPFNPSTTIVFTLPEDGFVSLKVYNIVGQQVATLVEGSVKAGRSNKVTFDASKLSSGIYFSVMEFGNQRLIKKMTYMK